MASSTTSYQPLAMCPICEVRLPYLARLAAHLQAEHLQAAHLQAAHLQAAHLQAEHCDCQVGYSSLEDTPINRVAISANGRFFIKVNNPEYCWLVPFIDGTDLDVSLWSSWYLMHIATSLYFLVKVVK